MCNSFRAVVFSALSITFSMGLHVETHQRGEMNAAGDASAQQIIKGTGVVKDVDLSSKKITIPHGAIPAVGWPAIAMRFTFVNADDSITTLKAGTYVDLTFVRRGNISLLKSINDTQSWPTVQSECNLRAYQLIIRRICQGF